MERQYIYKLETQQKHLNETRNGSRCQKQILEETKAYADFTLVIIKISTQYFEIGFVFDF